MKQVAVILLIMLAGCRTDTPPPTSICIMDGLGGAECRFDGETIPGCMPLRDTGKFYCPPSALKNVVGVPPADFGRFTSWCYDVKQELIQEKIDEYLKMK